MAEYESVVPGKWVGLDWVHDPDAAADIGYWKWAAKWWEEYARHRPDPMIEKVVRRIVGQSVKRVTGRPLPDCIEIPLDQRTKPMSQAEAGIRMGYGSRHNNPAKRREAAAKMVKRMIDRGKLQAIELSPYKLIFSKLEVPDN